MNYEGNLNLLSHKEKIAIVGSRNCSTLDRKRAEKLAEHFVRGNKLVITGLANGIDTHAAIGALGGQQIAVLPTLDKIFPENNQMLAQEIIDNEGLLLAIHRDDLPFRVKYLARDRVLVELAHYIFFLGDYNQGGTKYTYEYAKKRNKPIVTELDIIDKLISL